MGIHNFETTLWLLAERTTSMRAAYGYFLTVCEVEVMQIALYCIAMSHKSKKAKRSKRDSSPNLGTERKKVFPLSLVSMRVKGNKICKFVIVRFIKQVRGGAHCTSGSNAALIRINKGNR